jgi:GNAT superfamily N-acetyltransferase
MHIRTATTADVETIATLHADSWRATYRDLMPADFLAGPIDDDRRRLWRTRIAGPTDDPPYVAVAEDQRGPVGFVCIVPESPSTVLVDNLHVRPGRTGAGIGRTLLYHAFDWALSHQPGSSVALWVLAGNAGAIRFYERLGGRPAGRVTEHFDWGFDLDEVQYVWPADALHERRQG